MNETRQNGTEKTSERERNEEYHSINYLVLIDMFRCRRHVSCFPLLFFRFFYFLFSLRFSFLFCFRLFFLYSFFSCFLFILVVVALQFNRNEKWSIDGRRFHISVTVIIDTERCVCVRFFSFMFFYFEMKPTSIKPHKSSSS